MAELEKVIKGLECCLVGPLCSQCPYENVCDSLEVIANDALKLLKERLPRVLSLEEANTFEVVWFEDRGTNTVFPCLVKNDLNDSKLYKYGIKWRVWSVRPTEEQRAATPWG